MGRMTVISGAERRRRWSDEDRARILAAISEPGAVIAQVARREDVCTSLVFKWRREMREAVEADAGGFAPVVIEPAPAAAPSSRSSSNSASAVIEVELKDARVRIHAGASSAAIAAALKALRP
jgi:transposase